MPLRMVSALERREECDLNDRETIWAQHPSDFTGGALDVRQVLPNRR